MTKEKYYQDDLEGQNRESAPEDIKYRFRISPDEQKLAYTEQGDIWLVDPNFENRRQLVKSESRDLNRDWGRPKKIL